MLGKGLTFDFFSDLLVREVILVTAQCADADEDDIDSDARLIE